MHREAIASRPALRHAAPKPCRSGPFPLFNKRKRRHGTSADAGGGTMVAFNNEISSADKIGLHLSEIGRLQNNAGALLQFVAILFAVCVYFYNALVYPATSHRMMYASFLAADALLILGACYSYFRCMTLSVGWADKAVNPKKKFHFLSTLSEEEIEKTLFQIVRSFRTGTYFFFLSFFCTVILIALVAFGYSNMLPS